MKIPRLSYLALACLMLLASCPSTSLLETVQNKVASSKSGSTVSSAPILSPSSGTYSSDTSVTITDSDSTAIIYYTIADGKSGATPSTSSMKYSGAISIAGNGTTKTIEAIAVSPNEQPSSVVTGTYGINYSQTATPNFTPSSGTYGSDIQVTLSDTTSGAAIYYTVTSGTNGSAPSTASTKYTGPISIAGNGTTATIEAMATSNGFANSNTSVGTFTINYGQVSTPSLSPGGGSYAQAQSVTISSSTSGASICYTTDNSVPTESGGVVTHGISLANGGSVTVSASETIEAIAYKSGLTDSTLVSAGFSFVPPSAPTISSGTGGGRQVSLSWSASAGAASYNVYYLAGTSVTTGSAGVVKKNTAGTSTTISGLADGTSYAFIVTAVGAYGESAASSVVTETTFAQVAQPTYGSSAGTYYNAVSVTITSATSGAVIYYTTDGSTPTSGSSSLSNGTAVTVSKSETLTAIASKSGMTDSNAATAVYSLQAANPVLSVSAGTYSASQSVSISTTSSGAAIRYTTDGSNPTESNGTLYSGAVSVASNETLKAIAYESGWTDSVIASAAYAFVPAAPTFSPVPGTYDSSQTVTISSTTPGATIYYTTNGGSPTTGSPSMASGGSLTVSSTTETLEAFAYVPGWTSSSISTGYYTLQTQTPITSGTATSSDTSISVTISCPTSGAIIYYTTNGSAPSTSSTVYSAPITVSSTETIKAMAEKSGTLASGTASGTFTIQPQTPGVSVTMEADNSFDCTFSCGTSGVTCYYAIDGATPVVGSPNTWPLGTVLHLAANTTSVEVIAYKSGMTASQVATEQLYGTF